MENPIRKDRLLVDAAEEMPLPERKEISAREMEAELNSAWWNKWGTIVNVAGVAVGLASMVLARFSGGGSVAYYGLLVMACTVAAYAWMRYRAGTWEAKVIRLSYGVTDTPLMNAELNNAWWNKWGTIVNVAGVAVGLASMVLARFWGGGDVAYYGLLVMACTVAAYAWMRYCAGTWEAKLIELTHGSRESGGL